MSHPAETSSPLPSLGEGTETSALFLEGRLLDSAEAPRVACRGEGAELLPGSGAENVLLHAAAMASSGYEDPSSLAHAVVGILSNAEEYPDRESALGDARMVGDYIDFYKGVRPVALPRRGGGGAPATTGRRPLPEGGPEGSPGAGYGIFAPLAE